ncbi:MAG: L-threonylcarbamoyladenylate synthase [Actinomycetota bacterium]|nr:L-threonylcarbamoyladenylate synthase [Actinomycetota bacterium]
MTGHTVEAAVEAIRAGEVVGLPTDTVYGIGADPLNESAVAKLFELKGRPENKPVGLLVATVEQAKLAGEIHGDAEALVADNWPGALTLVVIPKIIIASWVGDSQRRTVGIRVPDHPIARELLAAAGPLAVTSANRSGGPEALDHVAAREAFGDDVAVYLEGSSPGGVASTVVDATTDEFTVLRQGPLVL